MSGWVQTLSALEQAGEAAVLVTVIGARGSTPREAGCKMVVTPSALHGTIGGGNLEHRCARLARDLLSDGSAAPVIHDFPLGPALGQCCGGHASVLFEIVRPAAWHVAVFGAGHVGRALMALLGTLPCNVRWIDPRADAFPAGMAANVSALVSPAPVEAVATLRPDSFVLVMTHDHQLDFDIVAAALGRTDLPFVGLIGSATKRARFVRRLSQTIDDTALARLTCPIGVPGAGGKLPAEIAIAVAAQMLQVRDAVPHATASCGDILPISHEQGRVIALAPACGACGAGC